MEPGGVGVSSDALHQVTASGGVASTGLSSTGVSPMTRGPLDEAVPSDGMAAMLSEAAIKMTVPGGTVAKATGEAKETEATGDRGGESGDMCNKGRESVRRSGGLEGRRFHKACGVFVTAPAGH